MKWDGERDGVTVDMSRPSSWRVGEGNAGGGGSGGMGGLETREASRGEGTGVIGRSSLWNPGLGIEGDTSRLWMRFVKKPENRFPARFF